METGREQNVIAERVHRVAFSRDSRVMATLGAEVEILPGPAGSIYAMTTKEITQLTLA